MSSGVFAAAELLLAMMELFDVSVAAPGVPPNQIPPPMTPALFWAIVLFAS
jgi:hypothetical protein